jgi:hypothetical protein
MKRALSLVQRKKQEAKRKWTHFSLSSSYLFGLVVLFLLKKRGEQGEKI